MAWVFWSFLQNTPLQSIYGINIFNIIPTNFHYWWIESLLDYFPDVYQGISIEFPPPIFSDITTDIEESKRLLKQNSLLDLEYVCNNHLKPTVMCPWGCSEFIQHCGSCNIDVIIQRFFLKCEIKLMDHKQLNKVKWIRDDYYRFNDEFDRIMMNPSWEVSPKIAFIDGSLKVLTCKCHDKGSDDMMIHTCRWEHNLAAEQSDQIAQVVTQSRIIKFGKKATFSNE